METKPSLVRFAGTCVLAFLVIFSYELARSPIESEFLERHGAEGLPLVWVAVAVAMVIVVSIHTRLARRAAILPSLALWAVAAAVVLGVLLVLHALGASGSTFALYVWKDVHVVVLVELVWSYANAVFTVSAARRAYGLFCACGAVGGITAGLGAGELAEAVGNDAALGAPLPALALLAAASFFIGRGSRASAPMNQLRRESVASGSTVAIFRSSYLALMLALVLVVQVAVTLLDYAYNEAIEIAYPDTDVRTRVMGSVYAAIEGGSLILQLATAAILRGLGVPKTLLAVPAVIGAAVVTFLAAPRFLTIALAKVAAKALDYSVFKAAKEILYIPLGYDEKTRGKAVIDMLTYRVAKGGSSLLLLGAIAAGLTWAVPWLVLVLVASWAAVAFALVRRYRGLVPREAERGS